MTKKTERFDSDTRRSSLRDLAYIFFRRKWVVLGVLLATVIPVTLYSLQIRPLFEASSSLLVKPGKENIYVAPVGGPEGSAPPTIVQRVREVIRTEMEILKSRVVMKRTISQIGVSELLSASVQESPKAAHAKTTVPLERMVDQMLNRLSVERLEGSDTIQVGFRSHDPELSAQFINTLIDVYLERHLEVHHSGKSYAFFRTQAEQLEEKLRDASRRLAEFKKKYSITSFGQRKGLVLERYMETLAKQQDNATRIKTTSVIIERLEESLQNLPEHRYSFQEQASDPPIISNLKADLVGLELERAELSHKFKSDNYRIVSLDERIGKIKAMLAEEEKKFHGTITNSANATRQKLSGDLIERRANLEALTKAAVELETQLIDYGQELERLGRLEPQLKSLERAVSVNESNYRLYLTKFEESRVSDAMDAAKMVSVSVLEPATPPLKPLPVRRGLNILASLCIGLAAGLALAFLFEYFDHTLKLPEDIADNLTIPTLGAIGRLSEDEMPDLKALAVSPMPPPNYQLLKNSVVKKAEAEQAKALCVCSATRQEGTSTIALNLAATLAKDSSQRVLLVDADLRYPALHSYANVSGSPGLSEVIEKDISIEKTIQQTAIPNLFVVASGVSPANPTAVFESDKIAGLIQTLKTDFDWVIFDSAAVNLHADTALLAPLLDGVVMVIQAENKRAEVAIQGKDRLEEAGAKILGGVLNQRRYVIPEVVYRRLT